MQEIKRHQAEDGSIWGSEAAALNHEKYLRGEAAAKPDIGYLVVSFEDETARCYRKVGGSVSRLNTNGCGDIPDAYEAVLKDIGYYSPTIYMDDDDLDGEEFWPTGEMFAKYGRMVDEGDAGVSEIMRGV